MGSTIKSEKKQNKTNIKKKTNLKAKNKTSKKIPVSSSKVRGSHEVRRAMTRLKVMESGINILKELGFQATTTTLVAKNAGVSRGALLHQFPTHCDLMLAIIEHIITKNRERNAQALATLEPGVDQFKGLTDTLWQKAQTPDVLALIEIHMASRSNPELAEKLGRRIEVLLRTEFEQAIYLAQQADINDRRAVFALSTLTVASVWGLSILRLNLWQEGEIDDAFSLLKSNLDTFIEKQNR